MNDNERTDEETALAEKLRNWLKANTRAGTRVVLHSDGYFDARVYCGGSLPITAYSCSLQPGHKGLCWTSNKQVNFKPEVGTERAERQGLLKRQLERSVAREPLARACAVSGNSESFGTVDEYAECVRADLLWCWLDTLERSFGGEAARKKEVLLDGELLPPDHRIWKDNIERTARSCRLPESVLRELWRGCATDIKKTGAQVLPDDMNLSFEPGPVVRRAE